MGLALAERAARRGAEVTLVAANVALPAPPGVDADRRRDHERARGRGRAASSALPRPADGGRGRRLRARAAPRGERSRARQRASAGAASSSGPRTSSPGSRARRPTEQTLVGFAAEHGAEAIARAREKLDRKGLDAIVFNDVSRAEIGFDSERQRGDDRRAPAASISVPLAPKEEVADAILDRVEAMRTRQRPKQAPSSS